MRVLLHYDVGPGLDDQLRSLTNRDVELIYCAQDDDKKFVQEIQTADILWHVLKPVLKEHIEKAKRLKLIQKIGVGVNTIDLDAARNAEIAVCNMPGTNSRAVAEMALMLMLAALRLQPRLDQLSRSGRWYPDTQTREAFSEIGGKTIGLVGFGSVPAILAPILKEMNANVIYSARTQKQTPFQRVQLHELLERSDIVSLHTPLTSETNRILNEDRLAMMKPGAVLVNTARGALVDEEALYHALTNGHLCAAGLDVFVDEPAKRSNPLMSLDNVVATPHVAWLTQETWLRSFKIAFENVEAIRSGGQLKYRVA